MRDTKNVMLNDKWQVGQRHYHTKYCVGTKMLLKIQQAIIAIYSTLKISSTSKRTLFNKKERKFCNCQCIHI